MSIKRRNDLSLSNKSKVIDLLKANNLNQSQIAKMFHCSQSQVSRIAKREADIDARSAIENPNRRRKRAGKDETVERELMEWYSSEPRNDSAPIRCATLQRKATEIAFRLNKEFKTTNGWLCRWKKRNNITVSKRSSRKSTLATRLALVESPVKPATYPDGKNMTISNVPCSLHHGIRYPDNGLYDDDVDEEDEHVQYGDNSSDDIDDDVDDDVGDNVDNNIDDDAATSTSAGNLGVSDENHDRTSSDSSEEVLVSFRRGFAAIQVIRELFKQRDVTDWRAYHELEKQMYSLSNDDHSNKM